eukprot:gene14010-18905_t
MRRHMNTRSRIHALAALALGALAMFPVLALAQSTDIKERRLKF